MRTKPETIRRFREQMRLQRHELRDKALGVLGNKCSRCGFSDVRALQIDHVNGDGAQDRVLFHHDSYNMYRAIIKGNAQNKYQLLCANCNWIKRHENREYTKPGTKNVIRANQV